MKDITLEVADVFRAYDQPFLEAFCHVTSGEQRRVLRDLVRCRTAALGGHVEECNQCGHRVIAYNSCRNRHCPKCQAATRAAWLAQQAEDVLDVEYFHVVFTLPDRLGPIALQNRRSVYSVLFQAAAQTLTQIAADPRHLGANIGFLAVLHTWGQTMLLHPHVHCVVPGGGLAPDSSRWISCRPGFFLPVRVLSRVFRGKFLALLQAIYDRGKLSFHGQQSNLADPAVFRRQIDELRQGEWVVYAKPPFGGPEQVLKYLARYTHRVAISNRRLLKLEDGKVHFQWKDYAHDNAAKTMALDAVEFIRRFLLHVLPRGFVHIRHYGFLANRSREEQLPLCRRLIAASREGLAPKENPPTDSGAAEGATAPAQTALLEAAMRHRCPQCGCGRMIIIEVRERSEPSAEEIEVMGGLQSNTS
jgi:hypothetical protein